MIGVVMMISAMVLGVAMGMAMIMDVIMRRIERRVIIIVAMLVRMVIVLHCCRQLRLEGERGGRSLVGVLFLPAGRLGHHPVAVERRVAGVWVVICFVRVDGLQRSARGVFGEGVSMHAAI